MKKIALILFVSVAMFSCGSSSTEETPAQDSTAVEVVSDTTVKPVDTVSATPVDSTSQAK